MPRDGHDDRTGEGAGVFTGIVEELGEVWQRRDLPDAVRLTIAGQRVCSDARHGDSIAVNGVCLTVVDLLPATGDRPPAFTADVMRETLLRSSLAKAATGSVVNLERAAALGDRIGGHLVQGHVDGTGTVLDRQPAQHWEIVRIGLPVQLARYVVEKGSVTVDGVSLTVVEAGADSFTVSLIPTTLAETTLGRRAVGDLVNLEVDVVAKYVERLLGPLAAKAPGPAPETAAEPGSVAVSAAGGSVVG